MNLESDMKFHLLLHDFALAPDLVVAVVWDEFQNPAVPIRDFFFPSYLLCELCA